MVFRKCYANFEVTSSSVKGEGFRHEGRWAWTARLCYYELPISQIDRVYLRQARVNGLASLLQSSFERLKVAHAWSPASPKALI